MKALTAALYLFAAFINLVPVLGVLSATRIATLYDIAVEDPNIAILMRHRAVLFAVVGGLLVFAAFHPPVRNIAFVAGMVSMLSFVAIALLVGGYNPALQRILIADVVASLALIAAASLDYFYGARGPVG